MFEELCGKNAFQNVILTTTMWDEVDEETGEDREAELKTEYWRSMLERGSTTSRFLRTRESAFDLIDSLIEAANRRSSVLLQDELVVMRKSLPATAAGQELFSAMGKLVSQREDLLRRIRHEMKRSDGDKMTLEPLQEEHQKLQNSLKATVIEMRRLRLPLGQRLLMFMTDKFFSSKLEYLKSLISKRPSKPAAGTIPTGKNLIVSTHQSIPGPTSDALLLEQGATSSADQSKPEEERSKGMSKPALVTESPTSPIAGQGDSFVLVSPVDNLSTGNISKNLIDGTHQSTPDSTSNLKALLLKQGATSSTDQSKHEEGPSKLAAPNTGSSTLPIASDTHVDRLRTSTISKDSINRTHQSTLGSTSKHLLLEQGATSDTDQSNKNCPKLTTSSLNTTKEQALNRELPPIP